jgi:tRNA(Ile)-lysidine synthase
MTQGVDLRANLHLNTMLTAFLTYINTLGVRLTERRILVAVSGGLDSVVLAHLFHKAGISFGIAHVNFGLRGTESDEDASFVRMLAMERYAVPYYETRFDTLAFAQQRGISVQMAARELRYEWFEQCRSLHGYDWIATAHHADDAIETFLLNFVHGTGLAGLRGILPISGVLVRPLLFADRRQIAHYASEEQLRWREDSSNASQYYQRNYLRQEVVPRLRALNPSLSKTFLSTVERLRSAWSLQNAQLENWASQVCVQRGDTFYIALDAFNVLDEPIYHLHYVLDRFGFSYAQARQVFGSLDRQVGAQFMSRSHLLTRDRTYWIVSPLQKEEVVNTYTIELGVSSVVLPNFQLHVGLHDASESVPLRRSSDVAQLNAALVEFPLTLRPWRAGDWFCPLGMKGKRKLVSDLLIDLKVSLPRKKDVYVLVDAAGKILWVVGYRLDDRFRRLDSLHPILEVRVHQ